MAVPTGAAWAPGHWEGLQKADHHHRGFGHGLPAAACVREFRERRELLTQIIEAGMFYNSQVRVGRVSIPIRESSQLAPSRMCSAPFAKELLGALSGSSCLIKFPQQPAQAVLLSHLHMTKLRLGEARSHWCSAPSGKLYPHFSPLLPQASRAREKVKGL